ncbi:MAG: uridine phosphorylase [Proteobacteria bacterium]|nr:MAG: uridine phosphorylase [Pseudomonadota bacterium]
MHVKTFHIGLTPDDIKGVEVAIIPGDPGRVPKIAQYLEKTRKLAEHREFHSLRGEYQGKQVLVISTGIGGPSAAICIEECAMIGIKRFLRVGTTGAIQDAIEPGDIIVPTAAVRLDGASTHIAPLAYPAVANFTMVQAIQKALEAEKVRHHIGICASSDTFYQGQSRQDSYRKGFVHQELRNRFEEMKALNVLSFEMECATVFTQCAAYGLEAAAVLGVLVNRNRTEFPSEEIHKQTEDRVIRAALSAVAML